MTQITRRIAAVGLLAAAIVFTASRATETSDPSPLTVHEWGTFTSIAAEDGTAEEWLPLDGPQDLPCFVDRLRFEGGKYMLRGTVRMETPVVYFYAPQETTVDVSVRFRQGLVTEWFPRAAVTPASVTPQAMDLRPWDSSITWKNVTVSPRIAADFPKEAAANHYYAARNTDATPLESGSQREKFLFYRGVGRFAPPLNATVAADGRVSVKSAIGEPLGAIILFENRKGALRYRTVRTSADRAIIEPPAAADSIAALRRELERILASGGLYPKEAAAMVETWRDSWFEEGARLLYIAPKAALDLMLPLKVTPIPTEVARVFVGRIELVTPRTMQDVRQAVLTGDRITFGRHGRFLQPITSRVVAATPRAERPAFEQHLKAAYQRYYDGRVYATGCR